MKDKFNRVEQKYLLTEEKYQKIMKKIKNKIIDDKFHKYTIHNLYVDTFDDYLVNKSLEKPNYKEKIRIRCYSIPKFDDYVYLEIKKKFKDIVGKEREKVKLKDLYNYLYNKEKLTLKNKAIKNALDMYKLKPLYIVSYDRLAYVSKDNTDFRITFDQNLRSKKCCSILDDNLQEEDYFNEKTYIMEIKTLNSLPLWFVKVLTELKIYPTSFSKIGSIYMKGRELNV